MDLNDYIEIKDNKWYLKIKVIPNSSKTEIYNIMEDWTIKIRSRGIPEKWRVNLELLKFISLNLKIDKNKIKIISWENNRNKLVKIDF